jgi:HD-like signal output (HDOD) protein
MKLTQIFLQIEKEIVAGTFSLPALPAVAFKVKDAVKDPTSDLGKLADIVNLDPSFSAYLISLANSPLYRGIDAIESLPVAMGRMGMESTRSSAMIFAVRSLFKTKGQTCKNLLNKLWKQSCFVSALSFVIAETLKTSNPEKASLAGLMHNIGMIPVVIKLIEQGNTEPEILKNWGKVMLFSRKVSVRVLSKWGLGEDIKSVAQGAYEMRKAHTEDLVNLVNLALWHSHLGKPEFKHMPKLTELGYFSVHQNSELDVDGSLLFLKESGAEVKQMMQALNF